MGGGRGYRDPAGDEPLPYGSRPARPRRTRVAHNRGRMLRRDLWAALLVSWLALAVRLWRLGDAPLWLDEAFSWHDARQPLGLIVGARVDVHPPLYYGLLHLWMPLAGDGEYALRFPSALLAVLAVPAAAYLARRLVPSARAV